MYPASATAAANPGRQAPKGVHTVGNASSALSMRAALAAGWALVQDEVGSVRCTSPDQCAWIEYTPDAQDASTYPGPVWRAQYAPRHPHGQMDAWSADFSGRIPDGAIAVFVEALASRSGAWRHARRAWPVYTAGPGTSEPAFRLLRGLGWDGGGDGGSATMLSTADGRIQVVYDPHRTGASYFEPRPVWHVRCVGTGADTGSDQGWAATLRHGVPVEALVAFLGKVASPLRPDVDRT
jgi:hypothetical protein